MITPALTAGPTPSVPVAQPPAQLSQPTCDVCPHPVARHDAISSRFCSATLHGALTRGCICSSA